MPEGITIDATEEQLAALKYNDDGLITSMTAYWGPTNVAVKG